MPCQGHKLLVGRTLELMMLLLKVLRLVVSRVQVVSAMLVLLLLLAALVLVAMRWATAAKRPPSAALRQVL